MKSQSPPIPLDDLFTIEGLAAAYPALLTGQMLRWQLRHRATNGMAPCCVEMGKRIMISKSRYEAWLAKRAGVA